MPRTAAPPRAGRRTALRLLLATLGALLGIGLLAGPASAHTQLVGTDPAAGSVVPVAPSQVTFTFNEHIRAVPEAVHLFAADGKELGTSASTIDDRVVVALPGSLPNGTYTVAWRVISADGHPVAGALSFSIGAPSARVTAPPAAGKGSSTAVHVVITTVQILVYLAVFLAIGLVVFLRLLLPAGEGTDAVRKRLLRLARRGADVGIVASALLLPLTTINQQGEGLSALFAARSWQVDLSNPEPQVAGLVFIGLALCVATFRVGRLGSVVPFLGAVMALSSLALVGHSRSYGPAALVITTDLAHVVAGSVWFGGLVGLTISLRLLRDAPALAARTVSRFSTVAAGLLATVTVTGSILAWRILGSWGGFVHTPFGRTLLVKLAIVGLVALLAGVNRWRLLPAVTGLADGDDGGRAATATDRLRRAVRVEGVLLVAVLAVTGILVDSNPEPAGSSASSQAAASPAKASAEAAGIKVALEVDPARVGSNLVEIVLTDSTGAVLKPYDGPGLTLDHGDLSLADLPLLEHGPGVYHAQVSLPEAGSWTAHVTVRTGEFDSRVIAVTFRVG